MHNLDGKRVAILATDGFEQSELTELRRQLSEAGAQVDVVSPKNDSIAGWQKKNWGDQVAVDIPLAEARVEDYDALVLPGGQINPDLLRIDEKAVNLVRDFFTPASRWGNLPRTLDADRSGGHRGAPRDPYLSIKTDMMNAGANWEDAEVVVDDGLVTIRKPADLDAFCAKMAEEIAEGHHVQRRVA